MHRVMVAALLLLFLLVPLKGFADSVLLGAPNPAAVPPSAFFYYVCTQCFGTPGNDHVIGMQFSLSSTQFVSSIDLGLIADALSNQMHISLQDGLLGTFNTFAGQDLNPAPQSGNQTVNWALNMNLGAGTYYLVLSSPETGGPDWGWSVSDDTLVNNAGTVTDGFWFSMDGGAAWTFYPNLPAECPNGSCSPAVFVVHGGAPVPEPGTMLLLGSGLLLGARRFRRRP